MTGSRLWYIGFTKLKQLKESPLAYKKATIDKKIETSTKSSDSDRKETVVDNVRDLLAPRHNHIDFVSYKTCCGIINFLKKESAGKEALKENLRACHAEADQVERKTADKRLSTWSNSAPQHTPWPMLQGNLNIRVS